MKRILAIIMVLLFLCGGAFATTRSLQFDALLAGIMDDDGNPLSGGLVYFYEAGTTTAKNVYTDKAKTAPYAYVTLGTDGRTHVYGDGLYKVIIKTSAGVVYDTWDYVYIRAANFYSRTITSSATATVDDDFIMCNTNSASITVTLPAIADGAVSHPLIIKRNGTNTVVIDGSAAETVDGAATYTISVNKRSVQLNSDGTNWQISAIPVSSALDEDSDTGIQVEETADEDIIRFDLGNATLTSAAEIMTLQAINTTTAKLEPTTDNTLDLGSSTKEFKNGYFDGLLWADTIYVSVSAGEGFGSSLIPLIDDTHSIGGQTYQWKDAWFDGTVTADKFSLSITEGEGVASSLVPTVDNTDDLGSAAYEWKDIYIDGTANLDTAIVGALTASTTFTLGATEVVATGAEINTAADDISNPPIAGDSTAGRSLRVSKLILTDDTNDTAGEIKAVLSSIWNGDAASEDDLAKGTPGTSFSLNAGGTELIILNAALTGLVVAVTSAHISYQDTVEDLYLDCHYAATGIAISHAANDSTADDISVLMDTNKEIQIYITYVTDE